MSYTASNWPTDRWPNFAFTEMACSETGECAIDEGFMDTLQNLRNELGRPMTITSGYRSPRHSIRRLRKHQAAMQGEEPLILRVPALMRLRY